MSSSSPPDLEEQLTPGVEDLVTEEECEAMQLLFQDGRGYSELAFVLERQEITVRKHVDGDCWHVDDRRGSWSKTFPIEELDPDAVPPTGE